MFPGDSPEKLACRICVSRTYNDERGSAQLAFSKFLLHGANVFFLENTSKEIDLPNARLSSRESLPACAKYQLKTIFRLI
jgi:hypothetical protein